MSIVRWGLLSTAHINRRVIPAIRASDRGELVGVASRTLSKAQSYADDWGIPLAFGSYEAMLTSNQVDAIYISLPNHLHAEWSIKALDAGKHVLCEKPFALSLEEVDGMIAAAERSGHILAEAFMYRHHPQTKIVGEWVHGGRLGDISYVQAVFNFTGLEAGNVRLVPEWGGGSLWDIGIYPVSLSQFVMGEPPQWVVGDQFVGESGVDVTFAGQMHYRDNRLAHIASSFQTPYYTFAQIVGSEGTLIINQPFTMIENGPNLFYKSPDGEASPVAVPEKELYLGEIEDMNEAILDGRPNYLSLAESRNHVRTALALYDSAHTGQRVHL